MRKLHSDYAAGFQQNLHSSNKTVQIRDLGQDVIAQQEICFYVARRKFLGALSIEKLHESWHAFLDSNGGYIGCWFNPQNGYPSSHKILQKVTVIARELNHLTLRAERETVDHFFCVILRVRKPTFRIRREIGVLAKNRLHTHVFLELHQEAVLADQHMKGVKRLHLIQLLNTQITLAQGRHSQIDKGMSHAGAAKTAWK